MLRIIGGFRRMQDMARTIDPLLRLYSASRTQQESPKSPSDHQLMLAKDRPLVD
jgi:hypothetical protein